MHRFYPILQTLTVLMSAIKGRKSFEQLDGLMEAYVPINDERTPLSTPGGLSMEANSTALEFKESDVSHDISASIMCEICGRIFRHLPSLHRHKRDDHAPQSRIRTKVLCDECGKAFRDPCDLKRHMHCHSAEKNCLCSACSEVFPNRGALHKHKLLQHDKVPMEKVTKHECAVCKRWFEDTRNLKRHSVVHTKQRPFMCVLCAKAYSQLEALQRHQRKNHQQQTVSTFFANHVAGDVGSNEN
ncbi:hypothetical protein CRM22_011417 [Opisthorchis felineus]|uniref:C2H2-type domain-containing protein n=1 Tax=Opisthorchis felineus TaxID=147828 RepID=A0A4S2JJ91_OPIFE|nr:hypothetical protein CRM22_011417 [Opisthorchis felineus]